MKGPKNLRPVTYYLVTFYRCPYCKRLFTIGDALTDRAKCFEAHRNKVRQTYSLRGARNFMEGKILKFVNSSPANKKVDETHEE